MRYSRRSPETVERGVSGGPAPCLRVHTVPTLVLPFRVPQSLIFDGLTLLHKIPHARLCRIHQWSSFRERLRCHKSNMSERNQTQFFTASCAEEPLQETVPAGFGCTFTGMRLPERVARCGGYVTLLQWGNLARSLRGTSNSRGWRHGLQMIQVSQHCLPARLVPLRFDRQG